MSGTPCSVWPASTGSALPRSRKVPTMNDRLALLELIDKLIERDAVEGEALGIGLDADLVGAPADDVAAAPRSRP